MINLVNNIALSWWSWMAAMFWQVSLLIILIACLDTVIKRWAWPQLRYALWLLVLLKLVLPPGLSMPGSLTERLQPQFDRIVSRNITEPSTITQYSPWIVAADSTIPAEEMVWQPQTTFELQMSEPDVATSAAIMPELPAVRLVWQSYAFGIWLFGMTSLGFWLISRLYHLRACQSRNGPTDSMPESFHHMLSQCARRLKLGRVPCIVVTKKVVCPAVFGIFRPVLLMPKGYLSKLSRKDVEHMLLHELAHIKRGDPIVHSLYLLLQIVYWFNPLLWLARRQLIHLRELCCDATVASILKNKTYEYRQTIIDIARRFLTKPVEPSLGLLGLFEDTNRLLVRLSWLEKKTWRYQKMKNLTVITIITLMLAFVLPMAQARQGDHSAESSAAHSEHSEELSSHELSEHETDYQLLETDAEADPEVTEDQEELTEELAALETELQQLKNKEHLLNEMEALRAQLEKLENQKHNLQEELAALEKARLGAGKAREQAVQAVKIAKEAKDKAVKDYDEAKKAKQTAEQWVNSPQFKQWQKDIQKWSDQLQKLHQGSDIQNWKVDPENEEAFKKWHQEMQQWQNSDEFKQWQEQMQQWQSEMQQWHQQIEHQAQEHKITGEAHEPPIQAPPMPHPVPQIPPMPPMPQIPEMVPMPPLPEGDASVNVAPVVTLPKIEIPEIVIPKINIPAIEVPVEAAAPVFTRPGSTGITQPDKPDISVKKDEDNKFVATREMEFVTKVEPGTPFVVQNKVGKIVVNPSKDKDCTVKAVIRATAETAEKAQELVEQVSMNCHSSKERFYFRPVKSGDDSWNNLNVDLLITVPSGVTPDISTDVGSIEIVDLKERIKCVTNVGSIRAVNVIEDIQLKTKVGDIEFVASNALSAKLQANTKVGSIESEFPLEINKVDMIASKANGTIGSGEKNVNLTTEVGKIRIKKQSSVNIF